MTLPEKSPKAYLEITGSAENPVIEGEPQHIAELEALFEQYLLPCQRGRGSYPGREALWLLSSEVAAARVVLESYKDAKGS